MSDMFLHMRQSSRPKDNRPTGQRRVSATRAVSQVRRDRRRISPYGVHVRDNTPAEPWRRAFADLVERARKSRDPEWSQERLADYLGVARSTIARWESGDGGRPKLENLLSLMELGVPGEDVARAVGLLPSEDRENVSADPDEQGIWDLGARRGWSEELREELIDYFRVRRTRLAASEVPTTSTASTAPAVQGQARTPEELLAMQRESEELSRRARERANRSHREVQTVDEKGEDRRKSG